MGAVFTREMLDKCPRHDHRCGLPHIDGKCPRDILVNTAMSLSDEAQITSQVDAVCRVHKLLSSVYFLRDRDKQKAWLEIAGLALRQATKEPEKPIPLFPVGDVKP